MTGCSFGLAMRAKIFSLLITILYCVESRDVTLTFFYDRTSYLPCERVNSDHSSLWLKNNVAVNTSEDSNIDISASGSLIFEKFSFSDTGDFHCIGSDLTYTLIIDCPSNAEPNALSNKCVCSPGATQNTSLSFLTCYLCLQAAYKPSPGEQPCVSCPTSFLTEHEGSVSSSDCVCPPGQGIIGGFCTPCPSDSYQGAFVSGPCAMCPLYSATPQPLGEAEAEGFTSRSDCICDYSPGTAANSTCWPFVTAPVVSLLSVEATNATIQWTTQSYAWSHQGAYRGVVAGYHLEVRTTGPLRTNIFTHKYTPADYDVGEDFNLTVTGLSPGTLYNIFVNAFTKSTSFVDGPPFNLTVMTSSTSTSPSQPMPTNAQTTGTPGIAQKTTTTALTTAPTTFMPTSTQETTAGTVATHSTSTASAPSTSTTELLTNIATTEIIITNTNANTEPTMEHINTTSSGTTSSPGLVHARNDTVSIVLGLLVVLLAVIIAVIVVFFVLRHWRANKRGGRKMRYVRAPHPSPSYGLYDTNATTFSNSKDDDEAFV